MIADHLRAVRERIDDAARRSGRDPQQVQLLAVSKTFPAEAVLEAAAAGQRRFAENRVQEAITRWPALRERYADVELHLVGPLQTNKVRDAMALIDVIETHDPAKLARALPAEKMRSDRRVPCYIQVNTGEEAQKSGIGPEEADDFIALCREEVKLPVAGLMSTEPAERVCEQLHAARKAASALGANLSCPFGTLSFLALSVIYTALIGTIVIPT